MSESRSVAAMGATEEIERGATHVTDYEPDEGALSTAVLYAIGEARGIDPLDVCADRGGTLADHVDPDVLDALGETVRSGREWRFEFAVGDSDVSITSEGSIVVGPR